MNLICSNYNFKMRSGNRRFPKSTRSTVTHSVAPLIAGDISSNRYSPLSGSSTEPTSTIVPPPAPKHFMFPNTPVDNDLFFETFMFLYTAAGVLLQFLHIYRSVWWLPYSYNTEAINFYLMNTHLVSFIMVILSRRLVYVCGLKCLEWVVPQNLLSFCTMCYRYFLFAVITALLSWCTYHIVQQYPIVNLFYLYYPILVYLILFGFTTVPIFEFVNWNNDGIPALHACTSNAVDIRLEVENLKNNFNSRLKQVLFNSVLGAYYAGLIPCCFVQSFVYYDVPWTAQHALFLWVGLSVSYIVHVLPLRYCDTLHRSALHLGCWRKFEQTPHFMSVHGWQENTLWPSNVSVQYSKEVYRSFGETNAAEPGNSSHSRFYSLFVNPSMILAGLFFVHIVMIVIQMFLLFKSYFHWHNIMSTGLLLVFNYYVLFKLGRDYRVSQKIYEMEKLARSKNSDN